MKKILITILTAVLLVSSWCAIFITISSKKELSNLTILPSIKSEFFKEKQNYNQFINIYLAKKKIVDQIIGAKRIEEENRKVLLGTGKTSFAGSSEDRITNIKIGALAVNEKIIQPGQEFSTLSAIGKVTAEKGYQLEANIRNGKTVMALGGGLCQISTTLFRAALNAGMNITARKNHAYAVGYYSPQGTDAAIANPSLDFKFINNTEHPIFIQSRIENFQLIIEIFGAKNNRKVEIQGPILINKNEDGSLETILYQKIYEDDILIEKSSFYSYYRPKKDFPHE